MRKRCPDHLALIEVNIGCSLNCPVCFANAGSGYSLTMAQVESMLDCLVEIEDEPEVVQFSGGGPTINPRILDVVQATRDRGISHVMNNTNGVRIAHDGRFLAGGWTVSCVQEDGWESATSPWTSVPCQMS